MDFLKNNAAFLLLLLSLLALVLFVLRLRSGRRKAGEPVQDKSGLWVYHKGTQFRKKAAYESAVNAARNKEAGTEKNKPFLRWPKLKKSPPKEKVIAVVNFQGDLRAKEHINLAKLVDEIEINAPDIEEVVVAVSSPGGMVSPYGHAFTQLERIRGLDLPLTVCIDTVAASGGYLMSVPATRIIAAPFAIVGSIGVMAFVPNFRNFLTRHHIDPRTFTSGRFKRTVSLTDDATPEELAHFQRQLDEIHQLFQESVKKYRPQVRIDEVATGDHWTAAESMRLGLGLVDELGSSHGYLLKRNRTTDVVLLTQKRGVFEDRLSFLSESLAESIEARLFARGLY